MTFEQTLSVGKPNSLGKTEQVVHTVLRNPKRLPALFDTLKSSDEWVRMRAGDAIEKVFRVKPELAKGYKADIFKMAKIDQPSVQWHFAQIVSEVELTPAQHKKALTILKRNLTESEDWIVLNVTMQILFDFAQGSPELARWLTPRLKHLSKDSRNSVAKRSRTLLQALPKPAGPA